MKNLEIRAAIKRYRLRYWQIAEALGISDGNLSRKLRQEFSPEYKTRILAIIEKLKGEL